MLTLAAVIFEICAFLPDCLSGAVSGKCVDQRKSEETVKWSRTHDKDWGLSCLHLAQLAPLSALDAKR